MQLKTLDHSALVVRDLERARWFYGDVLGMEDVPRPSTFTFRGCWFRGPSFELHLILEADTTETAGFGDAGEGARMGLAHHLGFEVADMDATVAHLTAHGVPILAGPVQRGDGAVQLYVNDPDGNFLEFFVWDPRSSLPAQERGAAPRRP